MNAKNAIALFILSANYLLTLGFLNAQDSSSKISGKIYFEYFVPDDSAGELAFMAIMLAFGM